MYPSDISNITRREVEIGMSSSGGSRISREGGMDLVGGGMDSRGGYVLKILYVKMKESGPLGGRAPGSASVDPPKSSSV